MEALRIRALATNLPGRLTIYHIGISAITLPALAYVAANRDWTAADFKLVFWIAVIAAAELIPVPGWGNTELTVSAPLVLAVMLLFGAETAALIAFAGALDPREFRREVGLFKALFNRSQVAVSVFAGAALFHVFASLDAPLPRVVLFGLGAMFTYEILNAAFVAVALSLTGHSTPAQIRRDLAGGSLMEFLFYYIGIGLLGIPLARLYVDLPSAEWVIVFFMLPLFLARQMFSRSKALEQATAQLRERERLLHHLSSRMAEERYDERKQIAAYLHDDLAQMLFRLGLQADSARSGMEKGDAQKAEKALDGVEQLKDDSIKLVRGLIKDLDRSPLGRAGLATALSTLATEMSADGLVRFHVDVTEAPMAAPVQLLAYQIAREAVQNAIKHAAPKNLWISVAPSGADLQLVVRDDGAGFDTEGRPPEGHFGMSIMRERAGLAGGSLDVVSAPDRGTTVTATFPPGWSRDGDRPEAGAPQAAGAS